MLTPLQVLPCPHIIPLIFQRENHLMTSHWNLSFSIEATGGPDVQSTIGLLKLIRILVLHRKFSTKCRNLKTTTIEKYILNETLIVNWLPSKRFLPYTNIPVEWHITVVSAPYVSKKYEGRNIFMYPLFKVGRGTAPPPYPAPTPLFFL